LTSPTVALTMSVTKSTVNCSPRGSSRSSPGSAREQPLAAAGRYEAKRTRIERLVKQETCLSAGSAMRLATFFSTTPEYWMSLQRGWDPARAQGTVDVSRISSLATA
jgi:addiction module HigA family antidote